jgi:hypothetical protein
LRYLTLVALLLLLSAGCKRRHHPNPSATIEEESELAIAVSVADPRDASQLLSGFYGLEQDAWRWTKKRFAVSLATPANASTRGAKLELKFVLPEAVAAQMLGVTITPTISGAKAGSCRVEKAGEQSCVFQVAPEALKSDAVVVQFDLDKAVGPNAGDSRELGIIAFRIGFSPQ